MLIQELAILLQLPLFSQMKWQKESFPCYFLQNSNLRMFWTNDRCFLTRRVETFMTATCLIIWVIIGNLLFQLWPKLIEVNITLQKNMFEIKCTDCGQTALVPFKPTVGKPAYCKTCFSKHFKRPESVVQNSSFDSRQAWARRRDNGRERKEEEHVSVFHQS